MIAALLASLALGIAIGNTVALRSMRSRLRDLDALVVSLDKRTRVPPEKEYINAVRAALGQGPIPDRRERAS